MHSSPVFARQEAIALTGCTSNRLQFLERAKLIMPHRIGKSKKPVVMYSWEQIIAIKVLDSLKARSEVAKRIVGHIVEGGIQGDRLFVVNSKSFVWASSSTEDIPSLMQILSLRNVIAYYSIIMIPIKDIEQEAMDYAKTCDAVDYAEVLRRVP